MQGNLSTALTESFYFISSALLQQFLVTTLQCTVQLIQLNRLLKYACIL